MRKTLKKSRFQTNKQKLKIKLELNNSKSPLLPNLQSLKQKLLSGSCFLVYKGA